MGEKYVHAACVQTQKWITPVRTKYFFAASMRMMKFVFENLAHIYLNSARPEAHVE